MVMHPQEIEQQKETERNNNLWWELDKITTEYSNPVPKSTQAERLKKANAAEAMMRFLDKPGPDWCRRKYDSEND